MKTVVVEILDRNGAYFGHYDVPTVWARRNAGPSNVPIPIDCIGMGEVGAQGWTGLRVRPADLGFGLFIG